ncbi:oxidoreductase, partial [Nocardioidaceae bacterium Broad-1]
MTMRAVRVERFGDPGGMVVTEVDVPTPGPDQVVIATDAIGVGGVDAVIRRGTIQGMGFEPGLIPGSEVAGTVTAVGAGVDASWVGRRVWAFTLLGGYAEHALARAEHVSPLPENITPVDAVTIGSSGPVAHFALAHAHFAPGESVLVRGAAGSIGIAAVEIAAARGASAVAVTTSSPERGERLRGLGATHVLDRSGHGGQDAPAAYDVIVDIVGGPATPDFVDRLAPNGRFVVVGAVAGMPPTDVSARLIGAFQQSRSFATFSLDTIPVP